jgi:hypothetical protein
MPTERQIKYIKAIQEFVGEEFTGTTKNEASNYIDRNIEEYKLLSSNKWNVTNGYF